MLPICDVVIGKGGHPVGGKVSGRGTCAKNIKSGIYKICQCEGDVPIWLR